MEKPPTLPILQKPNGYKELERFRKGGGLVS